MIDLTFDVTPLGLIELKRLCVARHLEVPKADRMANGHYEVCLSVDNLKDFTAIGEFYLEE